MKEMSNHLIWRYSRLYIIFLQKLREVFVLKQSQKYSSRQIFDTRNVRTVHNGIETLSYPGLKIWAIIPPEIKSRSDILIFKRKIRLWKPDKCPCRLCKTYVASVGFVDVDVAS